MRENLHPFRTKPHNAINTYVQNGGCDYRRVLGLDVSQQITHRSQHWCQCEATLSTSRELQ